jgi:hypothetical protein
MSRLTLSKRIPPAPFWREHVGAAFDLCYVA